MKRDLRLFAFILTLAWFCGSLFSQNATTSLRGIISDPQGAVIVGANVQLSRTDTGFRAAHVSGKDGGYQFLQIPPGTYIVRVESPGFHTQSKTVSLLVDQPSTLGIVLALEASQSSIEVD